MLKQVVKSCFTEVAASNCIRDKPLSIKKIQKGFPLGTATASLTFLNCTLPKTSTGKGGHKHTDQS